MCPLLSYPLPTNDMKFKQKFARLRRNTETREIAGQTFTFYPISVSMLFELKSSMEPLMKALKVLWPAGNEPTQDGTQTVERTFDPLTKNMLTQVTHLGAVSVEASRFRAEQESTAMKDAIEAVLGEKNRLLLGRVLADSLRDEGIKTDSEIAEFIRAEQFDLPLLVEFLGGFFAVNAKVFGPFAQRVRETVKAKMANLTPRPSPAVSEPVDVQPQAQDPAFQNPFGNTDPRES